MTSRFRALAGGAVWLVALLFIHPSLVGVEWAKALLVLAPLVLVPWAWISSRWTAKRAGL